MLSTTRRATTTTTATKWQQHREKCKTEYFIMKYFCCCPSFHALNRRCSGKDIRTSERHKDYSLRNFMHEMCSCGFSFFYFLRKNHENGSEKRKKYKKKEFIWKKIIPRKILLEDHTRRNS